MAVVLFFNTVGTLLAAGTTGTISGTITDSATNAPISGLVVDAVSPTGSYRGTTNNQGFFALTGVQPDTYTVSFQKTGYELRSLTGITISADQVADLSSKLAKSISTIARVSARSVGNAYQPKQTQDTYTVTSQQITTLLGKADATSETDLLTRLPGASLDRYGYPVLRGGRETEEGFQFDGIPEVDAFTSQFTNTLQLNPASGQLQLTPGTGDVSTGNAGTGSINLIAKRGAYPAFGSLDFETVLQPYEHQFSFEYGFATPNGAISNYTSFQGFNSDSQYGQRGTPAQTLSLGTYYSPAEEVSRDILDNFVYKFGKNRTQSVQLLYDNQQSNFLGTYGGNNTLPYPSGDPLFLSLATLTGLTAAQVTSPSLVELLPNQPSLTAGLGTRGATNYYQPNSVFKLQYTNNLSSSAFITAKYFQLDAVSTFDFPNSGSYSFFGSRVALQGGHRTGGTIDFNDQLNNKNLVQSGLEYEWLHPVFNSFDPTDGLLAAAGFGSGFEAADFINPNNGNPALASCPLGMDPNGASYCGYLQGFTKGNPGPIPRNDELSVTNQQNFAFYLRDQLTPTDRTNIDFGFRLEGAHYRLPGLDGCNPTTAASQTDTCLYYPTGFRTGTDGTRLPVVSLDKQQTSPIEVEPRIAVSFQLTPKDALRASFGRSTEFAPLAFIDDIQPNIYGRFNAVPSYDALANANAGTPYNPALYPAMFCGVQGNLRCQNYADQLRWENQNTILGVPIQPVRPETFTNYEFSYSHQFPLGIGLKVTPFYRRGYDALALVAQPRFDSKGNPIIDATTGNIVLGPNTATNLGVNRTTGVEFYLSREAAFGLSGSLTATYINEFSNVVPNPLIQEDFFPPIPTQSLALGNQYRVGFVSPFSATLALNYKSHSGLRLNPIVSYIRGYPAGVGNITAAYVNGTAYNILNTNSSLASAFGANLSPNFVDPQNPGSAFKPNVAATRGTPESASAGGFLTNPRVQTSVALELNHPGSRSTIGMLVTNLFNQTYSGVPAYNSRYQAVATGIAGPKTGYSTTPITYPEVQSQQYLPFQYGNQPYRILPNVTPQTVRLYYQLAL